MSTLEPTLTELHKELELYGDRRNTATQEEALARQRYDKRYREIQDALALLKREGYTVFSEGVK